MDNCSTSAGSGDLQCKEAALQTQQQKANKKCFHGGALDGSGKLSAAVAGAAKKLQRACQELQLSSLPRVMTGREDERDEIYTALRSSIEQQSAGGPIYISGLPGAGKTSIVKEVIRSLEDQRDAGELRNFAWVEVNGLQMPRPDVAYSVLWKALQPPGVGAEQPLARAIGAARLCEMLQQEFHSKSSKRPMLLVLLDEMDFMLAGKNQVLYNLLEWQTSATAKLVLVGIANTMDLPERLPTKIRSRLGGHRITFPAYTKAQLENIIQQRLLQLDIFSEEAIQICAKSLAHQSGDVRQALSLCRKSAEVCLHRLTSLDRDPAAREGGELFVTGEDLHEAQQAVSKLFKPPEQLERLSAMRLSAEAVQGAALTLEGVHDVHSRHGFTASVLRVGDRVADDVLEEHLKDTAGLLVDEAGDALDTATTCETADGGLGDALDVVAKDLAVTLGAALAESLAALAASRHVA
ncbi:unnamed protein product [Phytophthora fragariaefolia]|uniref:Origin recognition complex subunit 1 n=1 Tax=Phytophthora fragariaefolia TaxID=1490495 RepID=A0A9W6XQ59_9STRA|nr:unnamed protein product [Phytophthora fragariaefolia]